MTTKALELAKECGYTENMPTIWLTFRDFNIGAFYARAQVRALREAAGKTTCSFDKRMLERMADELDGKA